MQITAKLTGIEYKSYLNKKLEVIEYNDLDINQAPASFSVKEKSFLFNISKWVSPKRTRSYPFERVYNTLNGNKKITVIPVVKDEGIKGDRDFIQWDTISLMSLLDVYVILCFYDKAIKHPRKEGKVTSQKFNNQFIKDKIKDISNYHSSSLHWNLKEIINTLPIVINKVIASYKTISKDIGIDFHNSKGIDSFKNKVMLNADSFMNTSRAKAIQAQRREYKTIQPKEALATLTKAKINIENYLGGIYYFTVDEIEMKNDELYLIEAKHSRGSKLPSISDIKDGLLKMILYTNLKTAKIDDTVYTVKPVLKLTSSSLIGKFNSSLKKKMKGRFCIDNGFTIRQKALLETLIKECEENQILLRIEEG